MTGGKTAPGTSLETHSWTKLIVFPLKINKKRMNRGTYRGRHWTQQHSGPNQDPPLDRLQTLIGCCRPCHQIGWSVWLYPLPPARRRRLVCRTAWTQWNRMSCSTENTHLYDKLMLAWKSHLMLPDQLSIWLGAEGHDLPIRNRHFDDKVQMLVLVLLVVHLLPLLWFIDDDSLAFIPGVLVGHVSFKEVHSRLLLRDQLQLKAANTEVPPEVTTTTTSQF